MGRRLDSHTPVYEETAKFHIEDLDIDALASNPDARWRLSYHGTNPVMMLDKPDPSAKEPKVLILIDPFYLLAWLQLSPDFNPNGYEFTLKHPGTLFEVEAPLRSIFGPKLIGITGDAMGPVEPEKYTNVKDLENPFASPLDHKKIVALGLKELVGQLTAVFNVYDSPGAVRWAAKSFPRSRMDRESKTLYVSFRELRGFPNQSLLFLRAILENNLAMGWSVVNTDR